VSSPHILVFTLAIHLSLSLSLSLSVSFFLSFFLPCFLSLPFFLSYLISFFLSFFLFHYYISLIAISTSGFAGGDFIIEKSIMSDCSRSVFLLRGSITIMARIFFVFRLYHPRLVSICCLTNVLALGCFRRYIQFFSAQSFIKCICFGPLPKSVSLLEGDVCGLYVIVYGWF
jgi:hypothetical protein